MKREHCIFNALVTVLAAAVYPFSSLAAPLAAPDAAAYRLVWSDEFSEGGPLNSADWGYEKGFVRNEENQWYQPQNAQCVNGSLVIEARREETANPRYVANARDWRTARSVAHYTSASVTTRGHHAWLYGRFAIRARIDVASGSWPAFWTLGTSDNWPACGEVDVMESYRRMVLANIAWLGVDHKSQWNSIRQPVASLGDAKWAGAFHTWRMDWDEARIVLFLDDKVVNQQDLSKTLNAGRAGDNPFHRPMYLILNEAIGGEQGGDPSATHFPLHFEIDYVRVYQTPAQMNAQKALEQVQSPRAAPATQP